MSALIIIISCTACFYFWLGKRNAVNEKNLFISQMSLWKSKCAEFVRLDLKQKMLDSIIIETCRKLSSPSDNYFDENLTMLLEHRAEVSQKIMAAHMNSLKKEAPSLDDHMTVTDSVSDEITKACLDLIKNHKQISEDEAAKILLSIIEESRNNHAFNLLQGNWSTPNQRFYALMYGQNHILAEPVPI